MPKKVQRPTHLPHACGVYLFRDSSQTVLYVGKANDLQKRVSQYFNSNKTDLKNQVLAPLIRHVDYIHCASEREALIWERRLIGRHQPFFNSMWKDDKSYPYIKISIGEDFPRLRIIRKKKRDGAKYFGPFPKVQPIRKLARGLWKRQMFPLRPCDFSFSQKKPLDPKKIKSCLYYHTGECPAPCAGKISPAEYRKIADGAVLFFSGKYNRLRTSITQRMQKASRAMQYETAAQLRDHLEALEHMDERVNYREVRPGKVEQRITRARGVTELQKALKLKRPPHHIECFDISHLSGRQTVGSMVCFKGGEPHKSHYRRFRIKTVKGIDDFASIAEIVGRRYRNLKDTGQPLPDLVLIDGGKGQLSAAAGALRKEKVHLPLASLAKREEEIFMPGRSRAIKLPRAHEALHLVQRLRDEAHRFAITYNRKLRSKELLKDGPAR
jgi:excinuclease ABC subunit C